MSFLSTKPEPQKPAVAMRPEGTGSVCGRQVHQNQANHIAVINARDPKGVPGF